MRVSVRRVTESLLFQLVNKLFPNGEPLPTHSGAYEWHKAPGFIIADQQRQHIVAVKELKAGGKVCHGPREYQSH
jgi:hypothetical protein